MLNMRNNIAFMNQIIHNKTTWSQSGTMLMNFNPKVLRFLMKSFFCLHVMIQNIMMI